MGGGCMKKEPWLLGKLRRVEKRGEGGGFLNSNEFSIRQQRLEETEEWEDETKGDWIKREEDEENEEDEAFVDQVMKKETKTS